MTCSKLSVSCASFYCVQRANCFKLNTLLPDGSMFLGISYHRPLTFRSWSHLNAATLGFFGKFLCSYRPAVWQCWPSEYTTLVRPSSMCQSAFLGILKPHKFQKVTRGCQPRAWLCKFEIFALFNLVAQFRIIFYFLHKLWCLKQVLLIMMPNGTNRG